MKVLIIGSKGFIGSHLLTHFQSKGFDVMGADVVVDYVDKDNYYQIDASNSDFSSIFSESQFNLCVNCSGAASVPDSMKNPVRDYFLNTVNVFKILEAINKLQPGCKFINLSSAAVYGNPQKLPISENSALNPMSPYGTHKLQAENICKEFYDFWNIKTCSLRIFSVYGNGLQKQLFWDLNKKTKSGNSISLFGTGNESRDFIHISDLMTVIELIANKAEFRADVINVANGEETYIKDAVSIFYGFYNEKISYTFSGDGRKGDPVNWKADISKLSSLGYRPEVDMVTGLKSYYEWLVKSGQ